MTTRDKVRSFIMAHLADPDDDTEIDDGANIFELGFVDSLFATTLVAFIEKEFAVRVEDDDLDLANFSSVDKTVGFIEGKQGN